MENRAPRIEENEDYLRDFRDAPSIRPSDICAAIAYRHIQLTPDFKVAFEVCRRPRHRRYSIITLRYLLVLPFLDGLIGLRKPLLELSFFILFHLQLGHVEAPLRPLRAGQDVETIFSTMIKAVKHGILVRDRSTER